MTSRYLSAATTTVTSPRATVVLVDRARERGSERGNQRVGVACHQRAIVLVRLILFCSWMMP